MDHVERIRLGHGIDGDTFSRAADNPIAILQGMLERASEHLSHDLYDKQTHFLLELIQNADDNKYVDVAPTLYMRIEDSRVTAECNEVGFTPANVEAICNIGTSTKTSTQGFIGEKGIGFKSVFTVADVVHISSGKYTFKFDKKEKLGMITPIWDTTYPVKRGWTTFHLHLSSTEGSTTLSAQINDIRPSLLLFLRKLRSLQIDVVSKHGLPKEIRFEHHNVNEHISNLKRIENGRCVMDHRYFVFRHKAVTYTQEPKRRDIEQSEIVLAFPVTVNEAPMIRRQPEEVHAFLPLGCYGFRFIIQADFLTSSSREGILSDLPWNTTLRESIADAFLCAVEHFRTRPTLRDAWFRFLPTGISDPFFRTVEDAIISRLLKCNIFHSTDGEYRHSSEVLIVPKRFRCQDDHARSIIPEQYLPKGLYYLSPTYDLLRDDTHFKRLGVRDMSQVDFLDALGEMDRLDQIRCQPNSWLESVCSELQRQWRELNWNSQSYVGKIYDLRILPLTNGSWAPAKLAGDYIFHLELSRVPDDLGLQSIVAEVKPATSRYQLFQRLGVKCADPRLIAQKILVSRDTKSLPSSIHHTKFLYDHRRFPWLPDTKDLMVVDEHGQMGYSSELYLPERELRSVLPSSARFLHGDYMLAYSGAEKDNWIYWLRDSLGVNVSPRLVKGELSPELKEMTEKLESHKLLEILGEYWPLLSRDISEAGIRELSNTNVTCGDGSVWPFCSTYLKTRSLAHHLDLPFLPVPNPEDNSWNFLRQLGVATDVNLVFWIKRLIHLQLQEVDQNTGELAAEIYKQLDARFYEDETQIRATFRQGPLIFASPDGENPKSWFRFTDVYWDGPPSMTSKVAIKRTYPSLREFFASKLHIPNAPPEISVEELTHLADEWKSREILETIQDRIICMFVDLSDLASETLSYPVSRALQSLGQRSVFPVRLPSRELRLCAANEFYVPDKSGQYAKLFRDHVPLLAIPSATLLRLQPFLDLAIFKQRIRYLETSINRQSVTHGRRILDTVATAKYASRIECIQRVVCVKRSKPTSTQLNFLARMRDMKIYGVDSVESTLNLVGNDLVDKTITTDEDLAIENDPNNVALTVLISMTCLSSRRDPVICRELGLLLEIDTMTLLSLVNQPMEMVKEILKLEGIPEVSQNTLESGSWLRDPSHFESRSNNQAGFLQNHAPENGVMQARPPFDDDLQDEIARIKQAQVASVFSLTPNQIHSASSRNFTAQNADALSQLSPPPTGGPQSCTVVGQPVMALQEGPSSGPYIGPGSVTEAVPVTEYQQDNGVLGELYVYRLLCSDLDLDFGLDNWTSELRGRVDGYTPYEGESLADFKYNDRKGILTGRFYGEKIKDEWEDQWPTYHIEVKTTSGAAREPFYMSRRQLNIALNLTRNDDLIPTDIYVIIRVSSVRTATQRSHVVYLDPHRKFYDGGLRIVSDHVEILLAE